MCVRVCAFSANGNTLTSQTNVCVKRAGLVSGSVSDRKKKKRTEIYKTLEVLIL